MTFNEGNSIKKEGTKRRERERERERERATCSGGNR